ncbi:Hypothetical protein EIN_528520, partial [Entamoeba invadens IP1]
MFLLLLIVVTTTFAINPSQKDDIQIKLSENAKRNLKKFLDVSKEFMIMFSHMSLNMKLSVNQITYFVSNNEEFIINTEKEILQRVETILLKGSISKSEFLYQCETLDLMYRMFIKTNYFGKFLFDFQNNVNFLKDSGKFTENSIHIMNNAIIMVLQMTAIKRKITFEISKELDLLKNEVYVNAILRLENYIETLGLIVDPTFNKDNPE